VTEVGLSVAILPIRTFGDPGLRERARRVERVRPLHRRLANNMIETMRVAPGVGLAANQVGVLERIFVWEVDDEVGVVVNPEIVTRSPEVEQSDEGCLSLPGLTYPVERSIEVTIEALDERGRPFTRTAEGLLARVFQHEIDHLDGILFVDRLPESLRREAMRELTRMSLGLPPTPPAAPLTSAEETL
jgi:peptide deformylase